MLDLRFMVGIHSQSPLGTGLIYSHPASCFPPPRRERRVLAANNGWFTYMVPKFSLGRLCQPQDPEHLAETLDTTLHEAEGYEVSGAAKRLVKSHHSENFVLRSRQELCR
jgi:hypothetical protein